jgi:hypothetical protein
MENIYLLYWVFEDGSREVIREHYQFKPEIFTSYEDIVKEKAYKVYCRYSKEFHQEFGRIK